MTQLRIIEFPDPVTAFDGDGWWGAEVGDMWRCREESHVVEGRGPCWIIRMPDKCAWWHTNWKCTSAPFTYWEVTGEAPNITIKPSINIGPEWWHGWITDGVMAP